MCVCSVGSLRVAEYTTVASNVRYLWPAMSGICGQQCQVFVGDG